MTDPPNKGTSQILLFDPQSGQAPGETTAQQQLHDALFRGIVESLALAVFVFDSSFAIESVFMGCLDHVGPPEQLIGLKLLEVLPSDQAERLKEAIAYVEKTGLPKRLECTFMFSPNDSRHYVGNVVRLKTGNIAMFITDNTDTYAAGINLLESERRFRALIENNDPLSYPAGFRKWRSRWLRS